MISCACVFAAAMLAAVPERVPVTIEVPSKTNLQFFTLWVALGSGFFQEEGLEPRLLADDTPRNSGQYLLKGERDTTLYPAHPRAPDFTRVKAADYVAAGFADDAVKAKP
jgi:ABC-type nitrate/sulfonate/bicarbonate transport system substrate-binding protein